MHSTQSHEMQECSQKAKDKCSLAHAVLLSLFVPAALHREGV